MLQSIDDYRKLLTQIYAEKIPFNKLLGISVDTLCVSPPFAEVSLGYQEAFLGNFHKKYLHGGVLASLVDLTGGLVASLGLLEREGARPLEEMIDRFSGMATIDMRIDYLRPGRGNRFVCQGTLLKNGRSVSTVSLKVKNETGELLVTGTTCYSMGG